jgi:hypothetical protein
MVRMSQRISAGRVGRSGRSPMQLGENLREGRQDPLYQSVRNSRQLYRAAAQQYRMLITYSIALKKLSKTIVHHQTG